MTYITNYGFSDKISGIFYDAGQPYTGKRGPELLELGAVREEAETESADVKVAGAPDLNDLTVDELKAELDKKKIEYKSNALKADLVKLLEG